MPLSLRLSPPAAPAALRVLAILALAAGLGGWGGKKTRPPTPLALIPLSQPPNLRRTAIVRFLFKKKDIH